MALIKNPSGQPLNPNGKIALDPMTIPSFRALYSVQQKTSHRFLIFVTGGLGDAICAEPTIRWAMKNFKGVEFTICSPWPDIYQHLRKEGAITMRMDQKRGANTYNDKYYVVRTLYPGDSLSAEYMPHHFTHCVNYHALAMFRYELEPNERNIKLLPSQADADGLFAHQFSDCVIHPGRTWASRTIPASFWNEVIQLLNDKFGIKPTIIGGQQEELTGTVDIDESLDFYDLRGKLSIMSSVELLHRAKVLLSNDSSPIHMAASGDAWIGMISTVKRPDLITHWRSIDPMVDHMEYGWRTKNLSRGGLWETMDMNPLANADYNFGVCTDEQMHSWLPDAHDVANWAFDRLRGEP